MNYFVYTTGEITVSIVMLVALTDGTFISDIQIILSLVHLSRVLTPPASL